MLYFNYLDFFSFVQLYITIIQLLCDFYVILVFSVKQLCHWKINHDLQQGANVIKLIMVVLNEHMTVKCVSVLWNIEMTVTTEKWLYYRHMAIHYCLNQFDNTGPWFPFFRWAIFFQSYGEIITVKKWNVDYVRNLFYNTGPRRS